jgi:hypothetical protein
LEPLSVAEPPAPTAMPPGPEMTPASPSGTELESMTSGWVVETFASVTKFGEYATCWPARS